MKYSPTNEVECYLVVPPEYADQVFAPTLSPHGQNLRCIVSFDTVSNDKLLRYQDNTSQVVKFGSDRNNPTISFNGASTESMMAFEYIRKNNIPAYVYPMVEGSVQFSMPLIRGLGTDPLETTLTDSFSLGTGTTMYLPRPVASVGERMFPVTSDMPLAPGIMTGQGTMTRFPTGAGYAMFKPQKNLLKDSGLTDVTLAPPCPTDGWCAAAGAVPGVNTGINDSPWCDGEKSFWTTDTGVVLKSWKFDLLNQAAVFNFSCFLRTDGSVDIWIIDSLGATIANQRVQYSDGRIQIAFPTIGLSASDCVLKMQMVSGSKMEMGCPQLINGETLDVVEYYPYLGTVTAVQGELVDSRLLITDVSWAMSYMRRQAIAANTDSALACSGYWQSGFSDADKDQKCAIAFLNLYHTVTDSDVEIRWAYDGVATLSFHLYVQGTSRGSVTVAKHDVGDVYAFVIYSGVKALASVSGMKVVNMTKTITYSTVEHAIAGAPYATRLFVGSRSVSDYQCNGLVGGFSISSCSVTDAPKIAERLGDPGIADLFRKTAGRWYHLLPGKTDPHQFTRNAWRGSYPLEQMRTI